MKSITTSLFHILLICCFPILGKAQINPADSLALVAFYDATDGINWARTWDLNQAVNTWQGVTLNDDGFVSGLNLGFNGLSGSIPPEIGNLSSLTNLSLAGNSVTGSIPPEIGDLTNLTYLSLLGNEFTDIPPEIGNLNSLTDLILSSNNLSGNIPLEIGNLNNLTKLWLKDNQLTGNIPVELGNLDNLRDLYLENNQLTGSIPAELGNLPVLYNLSLHDNELSGCYDGNLINLCSSFSYSNEDISAGNNFNMQWESFCEAATCTSISTNTLDSLALVALYNDTDGANWRNVWQLDKYVSGWYGVTLSADGRVIELDLTTNLLSGSIPSDIGNLTELTILDLRANYELMGNIPSEIGNLILLNTLDLSNNHQIIGNIPTEIGNLVNLDLLDLNGTSVSGNIPSDIGNLTNLSTLDLSRTEISGNIPPEIGGLTNLRKLDLSQTELSGNIPPEIGNLSNLRYLHLSSVGFVGDLPPEIGSLTNLDYLDLLGSFTNIPPQIGNLSNLRTLNLSRFMASIPPEIGSLSSLMSLRLSSNQIIGNIPPEIGNLTNLITLNINYNELDSPIPSTVGNLTNLTRLDLSRNQFSGSIPPEIGNLTNLTRLSLYENQLTGSIPPEIGNLPKLTSLGLHINQLSDTIPPEFGSLTKVTSLSLHNNQLTGSIPQEINDMTKLRYLWLFNNQLSGCYDTELTNLCTQLSYPTNANISDGNNFETRWEYFCDIAAGVCGSESLCRQNDSLLLVELYQETAGDNWTNTWNLNQPMETWHGITLNENGCVTCIDMDGNDNCMDDSGGNGNNLDGHIPISIIHLQSLTFLNLSHNHLSGSIPAELADANSLAFLGLSNNELNGTIPEAFGNMSSLMGLTLSGNQLYGCYDHNLENLCAQLEPEYNTNASISDGNNFESTWEEFCYDGVECYAYSPCRVHDSLILVELYSNSAFDVTWNIEQPMDTWNGIALNGSGCVISLGFGEYDGPYTEERDFLPQIVQLTSLESISLGANDITGSIPPEISNLTNLRFLGLGSNRLSGSIPAELWTLTNLEYLRVSGEFTGDIPSEIGNLTNLEYLALGSNQLTGSIPPEIGNLTNLKHLSLSGEFTGNIPSEIRNLINLEALYLQNNQLSGNIPDLSTMPNLGTLRIEENKFSFEAIQVVYDADNAFTEFTYSPQYHGDVQSYIVALDTTLIIGLSSPLPGNNNQNVNYQWKRNDKYISGATDSTLLLANIQPENVGEYVIYMTDTARVLDLEVISEPIYVIIPRYDLHGQPVVYNQLMMEFDDETDRVYFEDEYLYSNAGYIANSCDCNRELYLWQFPSDTAPLQTLLAVNARRESIGSRRAKVDSGFNNIFNIGPIASGEGWTWTGDYLENYPDSVSVFLLDSGVDTLHWDASPYLLNDAQVDSCYNIATAINSNFADSLGHGTYGFRSIAEDLGDNINLKIAPLKVFNKEGEGTLFNFVCALYHAIDERADIIHVSAGYTGSASGILENAIALSKENGCLLVTAAGNDGTDIDSIPQYPAYYAKEFYTTGYHGNDSLVHYDNVISVASISPQDELSDFSNYSQDAVLISAYGEDMSGYSDTGARISSSGSSVSAFYVTRQLAVEIAKNRNRTYEQIWQDFETNSLRDCPATEGLTKTGKCLDINLNEIYADLRVYLEGTYDTTGQKMRNDLNMRCLLPGQIHEDSTLNHDLAVQPYDIIPPYYQGNESVPDVFPNYPDEVVDWILVSLRTEESADTELSRTAAWLLNNGNIQLLQPLFEDTDTAPDSVYVVIEHRNHLWTMSPQKIPVDRNIITWDFTAQDGYRTSATTGQIQLQPGIWAMLAGDSSQDDIGGGDINAGDKIIWQNDNGKFLLYLRGDHNLDGDTNGGDKGIWERNNGIFSGVPK